MTAISPLGAKQAPPVSVVMSARNEAAYIDEAVASVLAQDFADFELVIHDDGSTDDTWAKLQDWAARDERVRLFRADTSLGLVGGNNAAVAKARAPLIARMDADDIALPQWLSRLYETISAQPDVVLVSCLWSGMDRGGKQVRVADRWRASKPSVFPPFGHGSSMMRASAFAEAGGYREQCRYWEDFDLVLRLARFGKILFLPDALYRYRFASTSTRLVSDQVEVERAIEIALACAAQYRTTGDYEALLATATAPGAATIRSTPRTLVSLSSNRLWNGERPNRLRRIITGTRWPLSFETLVCIGLATMSEISPKLLRAVIAQFIAWRSRQVALQPGGPPVEWNPRTLIPESPAAMPSAAFQLLVAACSPKDAEGRWLGRLRSAGRVDAKALLQLSHWHRVGPTVHKTLVQAQYDLPAETYEQLADQARRGRMQALVNAAEEARLANAAAQAGLDMVLVKGATLAHLVYADPTVKTAWDIDVLVARTAIPAARTLLEARGYVLDLLDARMTEVQIERWLAGTRESLWRNAGRGTAVELHNALCESGGMIPGVGMTSPRQTVRIAGVDVPTLAEAELFAFLTVHGTSHGWARLKWLADVAALVTASSRSAESLHDAAVALGAGRCPGVALWLCSELFGLELSESLGQRLKNDRAVQRLVDYSWRAMDRVGDPARRITLHGFAEIVRAMRMQYWLAPGAAYRMRTFWSHWTRPYAASQLAVPGVLLPIYMIGWLPLRLLRRTWRRA